MINSQIDKVSVVVPVFNVEKYLARCLDSIVLQTYRNIEIIVVNDGSTDNSLEICKSYQKRDSRIILIDQKNSGLSGARNSGIKVATGKYICFIDSDDWIEKDYIFYSVNEIKRLNVSILTVGYYNSDGIRDTITSEGYLCCKAKKIEVEKALELLVADTAVKSHAWDKVFEKKLFDNIEFPIGKNFEDIFIMHELFDKCTYIGISFQPKYHYYIRENSIARKYNEKNILDYFDAHLQRRNYLIKYRENLVALENTKLMELLLSYTPKFKTRNKNKKNRFKYVEHEIIKDYKNIHKPFTEKKYSYMYKVFSASHLVFKIISPIANDLFIKVKRTQIKNMLKQLLHQDKQFVRSLEEYKSNNNTKIVLIGIPEYDNLGDVAIGISEQFFINKYKNANIDLLVITENNFFKYFKNIKAIINNNDVLMIQGGGNFGNQYPDQERLRKKVINNFKNRIVLLPSTFYLKDFEKNIIPYSKYYSRDNITIIAREKYSYTILKKYFKSDLLLTPDIVLSFDINNMMFRKEQNRIGLCLRNDIESKLSSIEKSKIKDIILQTTNMFMVFDTCINMPVPIEVQYKVLTEFLDEISGYSLVITDKLHAMIFCAITNTPCIAIGNYNYKLKGVFNWIKLINSIIFVDNINEIDESMIKSQLNRISLDISKDLNRDFSPLISVLKGIK